MQNVVVRPKCFVSISETVQWGQLSSNFIGGACRRDHNSARITLISLDNNAMNCSFYRSAFAQRSFTLQHQTEAARALYLHRYGFSYAQLKPSAC